LHVQSVAATFHAMHKLSTNGYCRHLYRYNMNRHKNNNNHDVHWIARPPYATTSTIHATHYDYRHTNIINYHFNTHTSVTYSSATMVLIAGSMCNNKQPSSFLTCSINAPRLASVTALHFSLLSASCLTLINVGLRNS